MNDIQIKMIARMNVHEQRINEIDREIRNLEGDKELIKFSKLSTVEKVCRKKDIEAEIRQLEYERKKTNTTEVTIGNTRYMKMIDMRMRCRK